ncbi:MAG: thioredoxin [Acholeplasmatales bacterium]|nr:thioredoxin [Acholeplasmatales bacterium]
MALEHITSENFKDFINKEEVVLIDFWAPWCGPCRMLGPVLEELNSSTGLPVGKVNVDEEDEISSAFSIQSIPTIIAFKSGKVLGKAVGYMPLAKLTGWIESLK